MRVPVRLLWLWTSAAALGVLGLSASALATVGTAADVSLLTPAAGAIVSGGQPVFAGATRGRIATVHVTASAGSWSVRWPKRLAPGTYTVRAVQSDAAGHTSCSPSHTFAIRPAPDTIGSTVSLAGGRLTVASATRALAGVPR